MKPLSPQAKESLAAYRREHALPPALRERTLRALAARIEQGEHGSEQRELAATTPRHSLLRWSARWGWALSTVTLLAGLGLWVHPYLSARIAEPVNPAGQTGTASDERRELAPAPRHAPVGERALPSREEGERTPAPVGSAAESDRTPADRVANPRKARVPRAQAARATSTREREVAAAARPVLAEPEPAAPEHERPDVSEVSFAQSGTHRNSRWVPPEHVAEGPRVSDEVRDRADIDGLQDRVVEPANDRAEPPASLSASFVEPSLRRAPDKAPANTLDEEVLALRKAYDLLRAREPLRALSALAEHARRFPNGKLTALRDLARIHALCDLGKRAQAREQVARFLEEHHGSPEAPRVQRICAEVR